MPSEERSIWENGEYLPQTRAEDLEGRQPHEENEDAYRIDSSYSCGRHVCHCDMGLPKLLDYGLGQDEITWKTGV